MAAKAPPPEPIPDWQYTLDEDARFYSWTGTRGFPAAPASWKARRAGLKILPLKFPPVYVPASIVTLKNRTLSPPAKLFVNCARQAINIFNGTAKPRAKSA